MHLLTFWCNGWKFRNSLPISKSLRCGTTTQMQGRFWGVEKCSKTLPRTKGLHSNYRHREAPASLAAGRQPSQKYGDHRSLQRRITPARCQHACVSTARMAGTRSKNVQRKGAVGARERAEEAKAVGARCSTTSAFHKLPMRSKFLSIVSKRMCRSVCWKLESQLLNCSLFEVDTLASAAYCSMQAVQLPR